MCGESFATACAVCKVFNENAAAPLVKSTLFSLNGISSNNSNKDFQKNYWEFFSIENILRSISDKIFQLQHVFIGVMNLRAKDPRACVTPELIYITYCYYYILSSYTSGPILE